MSANVETMMYVREKPWHGLGTEVAEAPNSADALRLAGLDWSVETQPIFTGGIQIPDWYATVRQTDKSVLGVVSGRYKICQNAEAFSFTDNLIGGDVRYETAGSLRGGRRVWLLAKLPDTEICGDKTEPYLCFTNTHDGTGAIRVCMTPVRVVCNNTLNIALSEASRDWSTRHMGNLESKLSEAHRCLDMAGEYMDKLNKQAERYANQTITDEEIQKILSELFPLAEDASDREKNNVKQVKDEFMVCWCMPDIAKFKNTAWGAINAIADLVDHNAPRRQTANYRENNWNRIIKGRTLVDKMVSVLAA